MIAAVLDVPRSKLTPEERMTVNRLARWYRQSLARAILHGRSRVTMSETKKGSRKAPRPTRKGIAITPHKGGRVVRFECRLTPAENEIIMRLVKASGLSKSD